MTTLTLYPEQVAAIETAILRDAGTERLKALRSKTSEQAIEARSAADQKDAVIHAIERQKTEFSFNESELGIVLASLSADIGHLEASRHLYHKSYDVEGEIAIAKQTQAAITRQLEGTNKCTT